MISKKGKIEKDGSKVHNPNDNGRESRRSIKTCNQLEDHSLRS